MLVLSREAGSDLNLVKSDHIGVAIDTAGASLHDLRTLLPNSLIDALSFQMIGASWNHHHHLL